MSHGIQSSLYAEHVGKFLRAGSEGIDEYLRAELRVPAGTVTHQHLILSSGPAHIHQFGLLQNTAAVAASYQTDSPWLRPIRRTAFTVLPGVACQQSSVT